MAIFLYPAFIFVDDAVSLWAVLQYTQCIWTETMADHTMGAEVDRDIGACHEHQEKRGTQKWSGVVRKGRFASICSMIRSFPSFYAHLRTVA